METVELWRTIVGSHVWGMNHAKSDTDYFSCFAVPTKAILAAKMVAGEAHFSEKVVPGGDDVQSHEIEKWVVMALKGNFNYMVGIHSPLVVSDSFGYLAEFKGICKRGMAKNVYSSIDGMARGNLKKYAQAGLDGSEFQKKLNGIARSLVFGCRWMGGHIEFTPVQNATEKGVEGLLEAFAMARNLSKLPETPANEEEYRDFLLKVRTDRW